MVVYGEFGGTTKDEDKRGMELADYIAKELSAITGMSPGEVMRTSEANGQKILSEYESDFNTAACFLLR